MYNTKKVSPAELSTYEALGDPKWKGRLCLRPSSYIYSQSLLATMVKHHGEAKAEEIVRRWTANQPTLINSDTKILEAIAAGQCDVGITNHYYLARLVAKNPDFPVAPFWANQQTTGTHVNISGAGVTAHAKNRADAIKFRVPVDPGGAADVRGPLVRVPCEPASGGEPGGRQVGEVQAGRHQHRRGGGVPGVCRQARRSCRLQIGTGRGRGFPGPGP